MVPGLLSEASPAEQASSKPTVYMLDNFHPDVIKFAEENFNVISRDSSLHKLAEWRQNARYLLVRSSRVTAEDVAAAAQLRAIAKQGVGIDKIDAAACKERGISILNTPGANAQTVAEQVLTLTMSVARQVGTILARQSHGILVPKEICSGIGLQGKTIGIIGMGNIGQAVARIFQGAFGAKVIGHDPFLPADAWSDIPHTRATDLASVWADSDVITVHMPLTPETRDLIAYEQMKQMKPTTILINTARGGIINETDLERALSEKLIWGAGLDCHEEEPPSKERYGKLWDMGVVSTPHIGAATSEAQIATGMTAAKKLLKFIQTDTSL